MKVFIVSDATRFALTDVYNGYVHAFQNLNIAHETFPYHYFRDICSDRTCFSIVHSHALIKSKNFTHIMLIGGLNVPDFLFESLYHIKSIVVATEDPHTSTPMLNRINMIDYYFSNERSIGLSGKYNNVYYCPTAADPEECGKLPREIIEPKYLSDVLFLGAMYPNRRKLLEEILPFIKKERINLKICGHVQYLPKRSPLWEYVTDARTIPHKETVKYYNGAKIVLNMLRDVNWNPRTRNKSNPFKGKYPAESLNPRAYEVPMCQSFMLLEDTRKESREIFTENEVGFFSDKKSLSDQIAYYLLGDGARLREDMAFEAYKKVAENHTYTHRLMFIKSIVSG